MKKSLYKRIAVLFLVIILSTANFTMVFADTDKGSRIVDKANLLTNEGERELLDKIGYIKEKYNLDVVLVTTDTLEGKTPQDYADDFYDYGGYGFDKEHSGLLFLVSMEDRDYHLSTTGRAIKIFNDAKIRSMGDSVASYLSVGDYDGGFLSIVKAIDQTMEANSFAWLKAEILAVLVAFILALISVWMMTRQMNTIRKDSYAGAYAKDFRLSKTNDIFMYSNTSRVRRQSSSGGGSSVHRGSSGRSHGGGGGKF